MSTLSVLVADLKAHVTNYIQITGKEVDGLIHKELAKFAEFVEGKQAEADALALLQARGYTCTPPPTSTLQQ